MGTTPSLAIAAQDGLPRAAFFDQTKRALMFVEAFESETGPIAWGKSVKVDPPDVPAENKFPVGEGVHGTGKWNALAVDREGAPHVVYYENITRQLKYAWGVSKSDDGTWTFQRAYLDINASNIGKWVSLALDDSNPQKIHVAFEDSESEKVRYLTWDRLQNLVPCPTKLSDSGAQCTDAAGYPVDIGGFPGYPETGKPLGGTSTSIALSRADALYAPDTIYVAYYSSSDGDLRLAFKSLSKPAEGPWTVKILDDIPEPRAKPKEDEDTLWDRTAENVGFWPSLAVDLEGKVHVSYFDISNKDLKYVMFHPPTGEWFPRLKKVQNFDEHVTQTILEIAPAQPDELPGQFVILEERLQFIGGIGRQTTEMWIGSVNGIGNVVDEGKGIGTGLVSSIAIGPGNTPIISFKDGASGQLKMAVLAADPSRAWGFSWAGIPIVRDAQAGSRTSLVTLAADSPDQWKIGLMYEAVQDVEGTAFPFLQYRDLTSSGALRQVLGLGASAPSRSTEAMQPLLQAGSQTP